MTMLSIERPVDYELGVRQVLADWGLLAGQEDGIGEDTRMGMVLRHLEEFEAGAGFSSRLTADGSPLELCERVSKEPQRIAVTFEPNGQADPAGELPRRFLCHLEAIASKREIGLLVKRLEPHASQIRTFWVGVDFARRKGIRLYCNLTAAGSEEIAAGLRHDDCLPMSGIAMTSLVRKALGEILRRGTPRVIGIDFGGESDGVKLGFAHPMDRGAIARVAESSGVSDLPLREYLHMLTPEPDGRPDSRCGLALAVDGACRAQGLTFYHYAAPYFRGDEPLRRFVLRLAQRFGWDTTAYRFTSRLLDREGVRVRSLLGFTASLSGQACLRLYGQTGGYS